MNDDLYEGRYADTGYDDESDTHSEDSNSENHWRNEYPDEDEYGDDESIGESDMRRAVNNLDIGLYTLCALPSNRNRNFIPFQRTIYHQTMVMELVVLRTMM